MVVGVPSAICFFCAIFFDSSRCLVIQNFFWTMKASTAKIGAYLGALTTKPFSGSTWRRIEREPVR